MKHLAACLMLGWMLLPAFAAPVLIVADEFPAMQELARQLKEQEGLDSQLVKQTEMPADLKAFQAVVVYIHGKLLPGPEKAMVEYTRAGGKLVALHHSISSGKRTNELWFSFLGVDLPKGEVTQGGYQWTEGVTLDIVNLATNHFVTSHKVTYPSTGRFNDAAGNSRTLPLFTLHESEVYLNHKLTGERTLLLGLRYTDKKTGREWHQTHAGWIKPAGKGMIYYLMPGHSVLEFQDPAYVRIVLNAIIHRAGS
ncbi:MAG: ThuA domain-containing protein [Verrucomicrobiae bacterium]|nr:ThuA domain-containing protein [Verrucomicrobiae bacterium]